MRLTKREKAVVVGGAAFLALLAVLQFAIRPTLERISTLRRVVADKRESLAQLHTKRLEYESLQAEVSRLRSVVRQQEGGRRILSTIERIREACGLPENALSLKPTTASVDQEYQETVVEIRLDDITLAQLVGFLSQLDSLELAGGIRALEVRHADRSPASLRAVVQLATVSHTEPM